MLDDFFSLGQMHIILRRDKDLVLVVSLDKGFTRAASPLLQQGHLSMTDATRMSQKVNPWDRKSGGRSMRTT
jgi:hypothetical protein